MNNNKIVTLLEDQFFILLAKMEQIIEMCPEELWNTEKDGTNFWRQCLYTLAQVNLRLREEKIGGDIIEFNKENIYPKNNDITIMLTNKVYTKDEIIKGLNDLVDVAEDWFSEKNDEWLKSPYKIYEKITNFDMTIRLFSFIAYHNGYWETIFRENGVKNQITDNK